MKRRQLAWLAIVGAVMGTTGCSSSDDDGAGSTSDDDDPGAGSTLTAVTYNAGLAIGFVPAAEQRAPLTIEAIADLTADVICVQEIWLPEHVTMLRDASSAKYPYSIFVDPDAGETGPAACTQADIDPLLTCVQANGCDVVCEDDLIGCVLGNCGPEFSELSANTPGCSGCLQANIGNPLDNIVTSCQAQSSEYAFGGAFGIALLSKHPLSGEAITVMESTTNRRAVISATMEHPEMGSVTLGCTHLTAVFSSIPYPKATGSWAEEQAAQIDELVALAGSAPSIVMGDMNTGPAGDGYIAEVPENYDKFVAAGLSNPYIETPGHVCTFCADNPLIGNDDDESVVIDHVFTRGLSGNAGERILDDPFTVTGCDGEMAATFSDHYGVRVTLGLP